jgi:hypothetical protein
MLVHYSGDIVFTGAVFVIYCELWMLNVAAACCIRSRANCCFMLAFTLVSSLIPRTSSTTFHTLGDAPRDSTTEGDVRSPLVPSPAPGKTSTSTGSSPTRYSVRLFTVPVLFQVVVWCAET